MSMSTIGVPLEGFGAYWQGGSRRGSRFIEK